MAAFSSVTRNALKLKEGMEGMKGRGRGDWSGGERRDRMGCETEFVQGPEVPGNATHHEQMPYKHYNTIELVA